MKSFKDFEKTVDEQQDHLQEGASWRKRWGSGGIKINTSASSRGLNASLSIGNTNKKGLGWTYNTNSGLTLSLRGTGLRWTPSKGGRRSSGTSAEDKERERIERGIEVYSDKIDPYISNIMDALSNSVQTILNNVKDATDQVNTLLKNNELPDQEDFDELLKIYSDPYSFLLTIIHETDKGNDLKEIGLTISGRNKIDGDVLHALDKKYTDEFKKTQYAKHASIECFKVTGKNAVWVEIKGLLESAVKTITDDMKTSFSEAASGFLANYYGLKLNIELEKNADDIAGLKLATSHLVKEYKNNISKIASSKTNTLLMVKLEAAKNGDTDMDSAIKKAKEKASVDIGILKKSSRNNFMMGAAAAVGAGALAVGSAGTIPIALASLYSLYHLGVSASKSGKAKQMKKDYELKENASTLNIINALKTVYSDVETLDFNKKKQIESMLDKIDNNSLTSISTADIKFVSDIAKKILKTKLKEETMTLTLEKIREIKARMAEEAEQLDELSKATLSSYVDKVATGPSRGTTPNGKLKSIKAIGGVSKAIRKQYSGSNVKEEAEQLDELSKETLGSYKHKAELSIPKDDREYANRSKGISKAEKKMKKEDVSPFDEFTTEELEQFMQTEDYAQLDELSKSTLGSYIRMASRDARRASGSKEMHKRTGDDLYAKVAGEHSAKRQKGIDKATHRLTKEEAEQLDELSKTTLASYIDKSVADRKNLQKTTHPDDKTGRNKLGNRKIGQAQADLRLNREEAEQLDELSRDTLLSYANKVSLDSQKHSKDPTKRSGEKASRSVAGYAKANNRLEKPVKEATYPRAAHTDVKDVAAPRAPAEQQHAAGHKVTVHNGIPDKHEDGADKVKGAAKAQPTPKKKYVEDPNINKDIYIQSFKSYVQMKGDLERM